MEPQSAEKDNNVKGTQAERILSDALIIAGVSFYGYCIAVAYGAGYNSYFNIPWYFVPLDLVSVIVGIFFVLASLSLFMQALNFFGTLGFTKENSALGQRLTPFLIIAVIAFGGLIEAQASIKSWILVSILFAFYAAMSFGLPLIPTKGRPSGLTYEQKLIHYAREQLELDKHNVVFRLQDKVPYNLQSLFLGLALVLFVAGLSGYINAKQQKQFEVVSVVSEMVILRDMGNEFLVSPFDASAHRLDAKMFLITDTDISRNNYYLEYKSIGPLLPATTP